MLFAALQPEAGERGINFEPFCLIEREIRFETKGRVFCCIQMGEEIVLLKQDTHGAFGGCEPCHIISVDPDPARRNEPPGPVAGRFRVVPGRTGYFSSSSHTGTAWLGVVVVAVVTAAAPLMTVLVSLFT